MGQANDVLQTLSGTGIANFAFILLFGVIFFVCIGGVTVFFMQRGNATMMKMMAQTMEHTQTSNTNTYARLAETNNRMANVIEKMSDRMDENDEAILKEMRESDKARAERNQLLVSTSLQNATKHIDNKTEIILTNLGTVKEQLEELRATFLKEVYKTNADFTNSIEDFSRKFIDLETAVKIGTQEIITILGTSGNTITPIEPASQDTALPMLEPETV